MGIMEQMNQFRQFMGNYRGSNPQAEAMQQIQSSGMSQKDLNELQNQANQIYNMGKAMGLFR